MALPDSIRVDDDAVLFKGRSGQMLLLGVLTRLKFAEPFQDITTLNPWMAELSGHLQSRLFPQEQTSSGPLFADDAEMRGKLARVIAETGEFTGWWRMSGSEKAAFVRDVAVAPHSVTDETTQEIVAAAEGHMESLRQLVQSADLKR